MRLTEPAERNRAHWTGLARSYAKVARHAWASEPNWSAWRIPEAELNLLRDVSGQHVLELGCETAYVASWLARNGARVVDLVHGSNAPETAKREIELWSGDEIV